MTRVILRPTIAADLAMFPTPLPHRIRSLTAVLPGPPEQILGVGGIGYRPDGTVIAFAEITEAARAYPAAIHRAGLAAIAMMRQARVPLVVAEAEPGNPAAVRWLERLGFARVEARGHVAYVWRP